MRKRTLPLIALALLSLAFAPAPFPRRATDSGDPTRIALQRLQGTWQVTHCKVSGNQIMAQVQMVIKGQQMSWQPLAGQASEWALSVAAGKGLGVFDSRDVRSGLAKLG